jgi:hypothetical protein
MTKEELDCIYSTKICAQCKFFTMRFHTLEPTIQRCKKYNKPTKISTNANDCKGYKER